MRASAVERSSGSYNSTAQAPSCIQFVKLDGGCSGSSLSTARKLLKLSFAGSTFIEPQTSFHSQRLHGRCFPAKLSIFSFTKVPYEFLHSFHRSWSFVSGQQCRGFRMSGLGFEYSPSRASSRGMYVDTNA